MLRPRNQFYEVRRPPPPTITISSLLEFCVHFEPDKRLKEWRLEGEEESLMPFRFAWTVQPFFSLFYMQEKRGARDTYLFVPPFSLGRLRRALWPNFFSPSFLSPFIHSAGKVSSAHQWLVAWLPSSHYHRHFHPFRPGTQTESPCQGRKSGMKQEIRNKKFFGIFRFLRAEDQIDGKAKH